MNATAQACTLCHTESIDGSIASVDYGWMEDFDVEDVGLLGSWGQNWTRKYYPAGIHTAFVCQRCIQRDRGLFAPQWLSLLLIVFGVIVNGGQEPRLFGGEDAVLQ
jgi:hypothetical protein